MRSKGKVFGALACFTEEPRDWPEGVVEAVSGLAAHAAIAIENAQTHEELRVRSEREGALRKVARDITESLDPPVLFSRICESVSELLRVEITDLSILDEKTETLTVSAAFGKREEPEVYFIPKGKGIVHRVVSGKKPVAVTEVLKDPDWVDRDWAERAGIRSFLGIPLILHDRVVGVLSCFATKLREFKASEIELVQDFADQVAIAIENARLYTEAQRRATNLEVLDEIAKAINSTLDLDELFKITVEQVKRVIRCERSILYSVDPGEKVIHRLCVIDDDKERENLFEPEVNLESTHLEKILKTKRPYYSPDVRKTSLPRHPDLARAGLRSALNIPILGEGECVGFLNLGSTQVNAFTDDHIELLRSVADHLAIAMQNAKLYAQVRETGERLDNFVRGATDAIITVDLDGRITSWNPGAEAIFGYSQEEILGKPLGRIYPEGIEEFKEFWDRLRSGETIAPVEIGRRRKDGSLVQVSLTVSPIQDHRGQIVGFSGINRDITERKKVEEALEKAYGELEMRVEERTADLSETNRRLQDEIAERKRTEEALRLTQFSVDQAADAVQWIAQDGQFLYVNDALCRMLGYSREKLLSMTVLDIDPDFGPEIWVEHWEKVKQAGSLTIETRNLTKDGRDVPIEVTDNYVDFGGKEYLNRLHPRHHRAQAPGGASAAEPKTRCPGTTRFRRRPRLQQRPRHHPGPDGADRQAQG